MEASKTLVSKAFLRNLGTTPISEKKKRSRSEKAVLGATLGIPGHSRSNSRNGTHDLISVKTYSRGNSRSDSRNCLAAKTSARILGAFFFNWGGSCAPDEKCKCNFWKLNPKILKHVSCSCQESLHREITPTAHSRDCPGFLRDCLIPPHRINNFLTATQSRDNPTILCLCLYFSSRSLKRSDLFTELPFLYVRLQNFSSLNISPSSTQKQWFDNLVVQVKCCFAPPSGSSLQGHF